jgi:hypothetical protein
MRTNCTDYTDLVFGTRIVNDYTDYTDVGLGNVNLNICNEWLSYNSLPLQ